ncbi:putative RNA methyltransferase [Rummeliibacillus suwonensis]|uniref:putative RNA methyltransferase n=1 Tax=Rummeliibacillus suwonensis TaxID=1306154 RepID=UPI00289AF53B|nr:methyltransferase domain-containing protein [Rummeliibacillus suwonensis]
MGLSRKIASAHYMTEQQSIFACPVCGEKMKITDQCVVTCENHHTFDIAKQGYVNFMTHPTTSMYGKDLFEARKQIIESGLYAQLHHTVVELLQSFGRDMTVLDTGCGEGSHLAKVKQQFEKTMDQKMVAVGIDIAKEGVVAASRNYEGMIWCVGDLAKCPFQKSSFDAILNILSPANYTEFKRLLKPNGWVVKVVPQSGYLYQLRELFFADSDKESYSNAHTVERFKENFSDVTIKRITQKVVIPQNLVPMLMHMTPMGWHQTTDIDQTKVKEITIDLDILVGKLS